MLGAFGLFVKGDTGSEPSHAGIVVIKSPGTVGPAPRYQIWVVSEAAINLLGISVISKVNSLMSTARSMLVRL